MAVKPDSRALLVLAAGYALRAIAACIGILLIAGSLGLAVRLFFIASGL